MNPLIAQVELDINELVAAVGAVGAIIILVGIAIVYIVRTEFEKQQASSNTSDANAEQSKIVSQLALDTSKQVGELQPQIIDLTSKLGQAKTEIALLTERGSRNEIEWDKRIESFELKLKEKDTQIQRRDKALAKVRKDKEALENERDRLLKDNQTLVKKLEHLADKIALLEARLELQIAKESTAETIPLPNIEVVIDENGDEIVIDSGNPATPTKDNLTQKPNDDIIDNEDAA